MRPPMPWMGGKQSLSAILESLFPLFFGKYIEVFGGGGALLFHKQPDEFEIYNDKNHLLFNFFRCVQEFPEKLIAKLEVTINSREFFKYNREILKGHFEPPNVEIAAKYYQTVLQSYAAGVTSFGGTARSVWSRFPAILAASSRLQNVVIENMDFESLITRHDAKNVLFYCGPPYNIAPPIKLCHDHAA